MIAQKTSLNALHIVLEQVILYNIPDQDCAFLQFYPFHCSTCEKKREIFTEMCYSKEDRGGCADANERLYFSGAFGQVRIL